MDAWQEGYNRFGFTVAKYLGLIEEDDYRRLSVEEVREIIAIYDSYKAIMEAILEIQPYCDHFFQVTLLAVRASCDWILECLSRKLKPNP